MRARYPDVEGYVDRDGVKVGYEVFGSGEPTLVFTTPPIVHSPPLDYLPVESGGAARVARRLSELL